MELGRWEFASATVRETHFKREIFMAFIKSMYFLDPHDFVYDE